LINLNTVSATTKQAESLVA